MAPPRRPPAPAPQARSSSSPAGIGIGASASAIATDAPRTELGEFAPNALTGWNGLSVTLARRLPADLHHSSNMVAAARRRLARQR